MACYVLDRQFKAKWKEVYGEEFRFERLRLRRWRRCGLSHAAIDFFENYRKKVNNINKLLNR